MPMGTVFTVTISLCKVICAQLRGLSFLAYLRLFTTRHRSVVAVPVHCVKHYQYVDKVVKMTVRNAGDFTGHSVMARAWRQGGVGGEREVEASEQLYDNSGYYSLSF